MNKLIELLKSKGLYSDSLNVNCHMGLRYAGQKDSIYSGKADEYKPFPFKITVTDDKNEILSITEADLPYGDIDGAEFEAVAEWLRDVGYHRTGRHRIWDTLVETGSEAPDDIVIETCNIAVAVEIAELKNRIDDLLFDLDDDAPAEEEDRVLSEIDEIHWRLFQLTDVFAKFPCDRDRYDIVAASHREYSAKSPGLSFKEYYRYFLKSEELLDSDGNLTEKTMDTATGMLQAWSKMPASEQKALMTKNLRVHPIHKPIFHKFVDDFHNGPVRSSASSIER